MRVRALSAKCSGSMAYGKPTMYWVHCNQNAPPCHTAEDEGEGIRTRIRPPVLRNTQRIYHADQSGSSLKCDRRRRRNASTERTSCAEEIKTPGLNEDQPVLPCNIYTRNTLDTLLHQQPNIYTYGFVSALQDRQHFHLARTAALLSRRAKRRATFALFAPSKHCSLYSVVPAPVDAGYCPVAGLNDCLLYGGVLPLSNDSAGPQPVTIIEAGFRGAPLVSGSFAPKAGRISNPKPVPHTRSTFLETTHHSDLIALANGALNQPAVPPRIFPPNRVDYSLMTSNVMVLYSDEKYSHFGAHDLRGKLQTESTPSRNSMASDHDTMLSYSTLTPEYVPNQEPTELTVNDQSYAIMSRLDKNSRSYNMSGSQNLLLKALKEDERITRLKASSCVPHLLQSVSVRTKQTQGRCFTASSRPQSAPLHLIPSMSNDSIADSVTSTAGFETLVIWPASSHTRQHSRLTHDFSQADIRHLPDSPSSEHKLPSTSSAALPHSSQTQGLNYDTSKCISEGVAAKQRCARQSRNSSFFPTSTSAPVLPTSSSGVSSTEILSPGGGNNTRPMQLGLEWSNYTPSEEETSLTTTALCSQSNEAATSSVHGKAKAFFNDEEDSDTIQFVRKEVMRNTILQGFAHVSASDYVEALNEGIVRPQNLDLPYGMLEHSLKRYVTALKPLEHKVVDKNRRLMEKAIVGTKPDATGLVAEIANRVSLMAPMSDYVLPKAGYHSALSSTIFSPAETPDTFIPDRPLTSPPADGRVLAFQDNSIAGPIAAANDFSIRDVPKLNLSKLRAGSDKLSNFFSDHPGDLLVPRVQNIDGTWTSRVTAGRTARAVSSPLLPSFRSDIDKLKTSRRALSPERMSILSRKLVSSICESLPNLLRGPECYSSKHRNLATASLEQVRGVQSLNHAETFLSVNSRNVSASSGLGNTTRMSFSLNERIPTPLLNDSFHLYTKRLSNLASGHEMFPIRDEELVARRCSSCHSPNRALSRSASQMRGSASPAKSPVCVDDFTHSETATLLASLCHDSVSSATQEEISQSPSDSDERCAVSAIDEPLCDTAISVSNTSGAPSRGLVDNQTERPAELPLLNACLTILPSHSAVGSTSPLCNLTASASITSSKRERSHCNRQAAGLLLEKTIKPCILQRGSVSKPGNGASLGEQGTQAIAIQLGSTRLFTRERRCQSAYQSTKVRFRGKASHLPLLSVKAYAQNDASASCKNVAHTAPAVKSSDREGLQTYSSMDAQRPLCVSTGVETCVHGESGGMHPCSWRPTNVKDKRFAASSKQLIFYLRDFYHRYLHATTPFRAPSLRSCSTSLRNRSLSAVSGTPSSTRVSCTNSSLRFPQNWQRALCATDVSISRVKRKFSGPSDLRADSLTPLIPAVTRGMSAPDRRRSVLDTSLAFNTLSPATIACHIHSPLNSSMVYDTIEFSRVNSLSFGRCRPFSVHGRSNSYLSTCDCPMSTGSGQQVHSAGSLSNTSTSAVPVCYSRESNYAGFFGILKNSSDARTIFNTQTSESFESTKPRSEKGLPLGSSIDRLKMLTELSINKGQHVLECVDSLATFPAGDNSSLCMTDASLSDRVVTPGSDMHNIRMPWHTSDSRPHTAPRVSSALRTANLIVDRPEFQHIEKQVAADSGSPVEMGGSGVSSAGHQLSNSSGFAPLSLHFGEASQSTADPTNRPAEKLNIQQPQSPRSTWMQPDESAFFPPLLHSACSGATPREVQVCSDTAKEYAQNDGLSIQNHNARCYSSSSALANILTNPGTSRMPCINHTSSQATALPMHSKMQPSIASPPKPLNHLRLHFRPTYTPAVMYSYTHDPPKSCIMPPSMQTADGLKHLIVAQKQILSNLRTVSHPDAKHSTRPSIHDALRRFVPPSLSHKILKDSPIRLDKLFPCSKQNVHSTLRRILPNIPVLEKNY